MVGTFFVAGIAFMLAGVVAAAVNAIDPWVHGRWLALHLIFVGGISQLVLGASQFFAGAFLATDPPPRALVRTQLATWNAGTVALALAVAVDSDPLLVIAVALLLAALGIYGATLARMRRSSLRSGIWAVRWYAAAAVLFAFGVVAGGVLARPFPWPDGDLLAAHMALNLAGWFGAAIVGTLHTFYPSLTRTELRFARLEPPTFAAWVLGVAGLAVGYGWSLDALAVAGWLALLVAACLLLANVAGCALRAARPMSLAAQVVGGAQPLLLVALALAAATALADGPGQALAGTTRTAVAILVVAGWVGLTVLGSLLHLLSVVLRVRNFARSMPQPRPRRDAAIAGLAAGGVLVFGLASAAEIDGLRILGLIALAPACTALAAMVVGLAARVVVEARPRI